MLLCFQKSNVLVCGGSADVAHSRQFADVELTVFVCGIVAEKTCGDVLFAVCEIFLDGVMKNAIMKTGKYKDRKEDDYVLCTVRDGNSG